MENNPSWLDMSAKNDIHLYKYLYNSEGHLIPENVSHVDTMLLYTKCRRCDMRVHLQLYTPQEYRRTPLLTCVCTRGHYMNLKWYADKIRMAFS